MALKKFIGARYAPEFAGAWSNAKQYAALSVVYADNRSYVSRKTVPAGTPITNTEFWIQSSDWNAQVAEYNLKVEGYNANVEQYNRNVQDYSAAVSGFYADTLHSFDTKADMQADRTLALGETLLTCGDKKIGDGGGSFYQVVSDTSVTAVALDNGLFAEPFEFQPYDYSQFQQEVEGYKDSTTRVYNTQQDMVADVGINTGNILMTTGALEQGDGQGSFWNVTDNQEEGSVLLQNGKYAKKFNIASVDTSGNLLFNNKGNQVAIWGVKAGGEAVNIPVSYSLGETRTVYVAVEYGSDNTNATVNLVVSGPVSFTKVFAWGDASATSGQVKTVIYAITLNSKGNNVYTGAQVVTSYTTSLEQFIEMTTVNVPNQSQALNAWSGETATTFGADFTITKNIVIKSIITTPKVYKPSTSGNNILCFINSLDEQQSEGGVAIGTVSGKPEEPITFTFNRYLEADGLNKEISFNSNSSTSKLYTASRASGSFGDISFLGRLSDHFQGKINYLVVTPNGSNDYSIGDADAVWNGNGYRASEAKFTVSRECILKSITFKSRVSRFKVTITSSNGGFEGDKTINDQTKHFTTDMYLVPDTEYTLKFENPSTTFNMPSKANGTYGPITFTRGYYQGTMSIIEV